MLFIYIYTQNFSPHFFVLFNTKSVATLELTTDTNPLLLHFVIIFFFFFFISLAIITDVGFGVVFLNKNAPFLLLFSALSDLQ